MAEITATVSLQDNLTDALKRMADQLEKLDRKLNSLGATAQEQADQVAKKTNSVSSSILKLASVAGAIKIGKTLIQASDELVGIDTRLQAVTGSAEKAAQAENEIYQAASRARAFYTSTADMVAKLQVNAGDVFGNMDETVLFAETLQKQFALSGTNATDAAAATLQLTQAMGSGVLRGDELNSVFENAPSVIGLIAKEMNVPVGQIRGMAAEGQITADIVKKAMIDAADETDKAFQKTPWTWSQVWTAVVNQVPQVTKPLLDVISLVAQHWQQIEPIVVIVGAAVAGYTAVLFANAAAHKIAEAAEATHSAATMLASGETMTATIAQYGYNAAILACPITWFVVGIVAAVVAVILLAQHIARAGSVAQSAFGVMAGWVNVMRVAFIKLGEGVKNVFTWIGKAAKVTGENIDAGLKYGVTKAMGYFGKLQSFAGGVFSKIGGVLGKVPGLSSVGESIASKGMQMASSGAAKEAASAGASASFKSLPSYSGVDTFDSGWASAAYAAGAKWGDKKWSNSIFGAGNTSIDGLLNSVKNSAGSTPAASSGDSGSGSKDKSGKSGSDKTGKIASNTDQMANDLDYLVAIASRQAINTFTTASINVVMNNNNTINKDIDIDQVVSQLTDVTKNALVATAEGVHI